MIIGVDVDDVCGDLINPWIMKYNRDYNDNLEKKDVTDWAVHTFVKPECGREIYKYIEDRSLYDEVKPIPFSLEAVKNLKHMGRVVFITSSTIGAAGRKFLWLQEHGFIETIDDYVEAKDKTLIAYDFLIDDNYHNVKYGDNNILFNQPWNLKYDYPNRLVGWEYYLKTGHLC